MRTRALLAGTAGLMLPLLACSQGPELRLPSSPDFGQPVTETVNITLGALPMKFVASLMGGDEGDGSDNAALGKTLAGVKSVQIRSYRFESDYACPEADLGSLRSQLAAPGWTRLVEAQRRDKGNVAVYLALDDHVVRGLAILACQPREFTIVNVVGTIDVDQVARLRHSFTAGTTGTM
jgi:Domain of unknown function (DUF4252)